MSLRLQLPQTDSTELHPVVYRAAIALLLWFVVAAWLLFGEKGYVALALVMISVLAIMVVAIPTALWRTGTRGGPRRAAGGESWHSGGAVSFRCRPIGRKV